jgi:hypothetical protein
MIRVGSKPKLRTDTHVICSKNFLGVSSNRDGTFGPVPRDQAESQQESLRTMPK